MKKILYSLAPEKYPDIELDFIETTAENSRNYTSNEIVYATKTSHVTAEIVNKDIEVITNPRVEINNKTYYLEETHTTAHSGDWIITNPDGEQYVLPNERFIKKYKPSGNNKFISIEETKQFSQITENICFLNLQGNWRFVTKGSYICTSVDPKKTYGITNSAFNSTYKINNKIIVLTKEFVINKYKEKYLDSYENISEFKLLILLIENYENIAISKDLPDYLFFDNFDLMLEIFGGWQYDKMTDSEIEKLANIINTALKLGVNDYHIENVFFAISTYAPKDVFKSFSLKLNHKAKTLLKK